MARLDPNPVEGEWQQKEGEDLNAFLNRTGKMLQDLFIQSDALPEGHILGGVISFPVADGKAFYLVSKLRPLTLKHIPFGDAWKVADPYLRGLSKKDIDMQLRSTRRLLKLFPRRPLLTTYPTETGNAQAP